MTKIRRPYGYANGQQKMDDGLANYQDSIDQYERDGLSTLDKSEGYRTEDLGASAMGNVSADPKLKEAQMAALQELRDRSKNGMTLRDKANLEAAQADANQANASRQESLKQEFASRPGGGGASEAVMRMQALQSANGRASSQAQEVAARSEQNRMNSTQALGNLSGSMRDQDVQEQSAKAQAADRIAQYNNGNRNQATRDQYGENNNRDHTNNQNKMGFQQNKLQANQAGAQVLYNAGAEQDNANRLREQERQRNKKSQMGSALGIAGGVAGAYFGGPAGASAGYSAGNAIGQSFAHGGKVAGTEIVEGDHSANDIIPITVSAGETVLPKSASSDGQSAKQFVDKLNGTSEKSTDEVVADFFTTLGTLMKRR